MLFTPNRKISLDECCLLHELTLLRRRRQLIRIEEKEKNNEK